MFKRTSLLVILQPNDPYNSIESHFCYYTQPLLFAVYNIFDTSCPIIRLYTIGECVYVCVSVNVHKPVKYFMFVSGVRVKLSIRTHLNALNMIEVLLVIRDNYITYRKVHTVSRDVTTFLFLLYFCAIVKRLTLFHAI